MDQCPHFILDRSHRSIAYLADAAWRAFRRDQSGAPAHLGIVLPLALGACFINPYGARGVWEPVDFLLHGRAELIFRTVDELRPIDWGENLRNGLPLYLVALVTLAVWRLRTIAFDPAQAILLAALIPQAIAANRFLGVLAVAVSPMMARDAESLLASLSVRRGVRSAFAQWALLMLPIVIFVGLEFTRLAPPFGLGVRWDRVPVRACDAIEHLGIRGRGYNMFWHGGYLLWRFWPDRERLPFMDIHQTGSRTDRDLQILSQVDSSAWRVLDGHYQFDWVLLPTRQAPGQHLLDFMDGDVKNWAMVFTDDVATVFVRRSGRLTALAARAGYGHLRLGSVQYVALGQAALTDSLLRQDLGPELDRAITESEWHSRPLSLRASLAMIEPRWTEAQRDLEAALNVAPGLERGYDRLALVYIKTNRPGMAIRAIERAKHMGMAQEVAAKLLDQARLLRAASSPVK